jgi:hypothetical protein
MLLVKSKSVRVASFEASPESSQRAAIVSVFWCLPAWPDRFIRGKDGA